MKLVLLMITTGMLLAACAPDEEIVQIYKGDQGPPGMSCTVSPMEGGASLSCSDGSEVFVANGLPGPQGPQGIPGIAGEDGQNGNSDDSSSSATLDDYSGSSCTKISGTSSYVKKSGANYKLYTSSSCSSSSAFAEVSQGEAYWVSATALAVHAGSKLRVITFGGGD